MILLVNHDLYANVVISQILYDSPYNEVITKYPYSDGEFIELYNTGTEDVSLNGWKICGGGKTENYVFPSNTIIPSGGYLAIAFRYSNSNGDFHLSDYVFMSNNDASYQVQEQDILILSNTGELISLKDANNQVVDSIRYKKQATTTNLDSIPYMECISLHRKIININEGMIVSNTLKDWQAAPISFGSDIPIEQCIISENYYHYPQEISAKKNYRIMVQPLDETASITLDNGNVSTTDNARAKITYTYYDGLGKPEINVLRKQTPEGKDIANLITYNALGNEMKRWLPAPIDDGSNMAPSTLTPVISSYYQDEMPYSQTIYESDVLARPIASTIAGETYYAHPNMLSYQTNNANEIVKFTVSKTGLKKDAYYPAGVLNKVIELDADGKRSVKFTTMKGLLLMEQTGTDNKTYYVYDEYDRLCYVFPEFLASCLTSGITGDNELYMRQYAYIYRYDSRDNLIYKQLPSCEPVLMVYDITGKLILSQDGNQRERGDFWLYNAYDQLGRVVYTCEIFLPQLTHQHLMTMFKDVVAQESFSKENSLYDIGYTNSYFPSDDIRLLQVNYYDNYHFLQLLSQDTAQLLMHQELSGFGTPHLNARGLLTGQRVYNLNDKTYKVTAIYYDIYGNIIQRRNTSRLSGYHHQYAAYNFDRSLKQTLDEWEDLTEYYQYVYDHAGRLLKTLYSLNDNPKILLNVNKYDPLGNLIDKTRHNGADKEHFDYDMRGTLTHISSGDFFEHLYYAENIPNEVNPVYNGNISATTISQGGQTFNFRYQYNPQNWLSSSVLYSENATTDSEVFEYDPLGNITQLKRYDNGVLIDDLTMQYEGHQLTHIHDESKNSNLYNLKEYVTRDSQIGMLYDANGNLTTDSDRGISEIKYNLLNLPDTIKFDNGNLIAYQYDALGTKIKTSYQTMLEPILTTIVETPAIQTNYLLTHTMELWYEDNRQKQRILKSDSLWKWEKELVFNKEGYTEYVLDDTLIVGTDMYYYRRNHLGSNVAVWNATKNETPQRMFYYASGLPMKVSIGQNIQRYKYNNKEFEEMHGLNEYDNQARRYYPAICRTTTMDPLAEKYYSMSPYAWCGNNPVRFVDPDGKSYNINTDGSMKFVDDNLNNLVVLNANHEIDRTEIYLEKGNIIGITESEDVNIIELDNKEVANELYESMGVHMNSLEFNNVATLKNSIPHYYIGTSGEMHKTRVGAYLFLHQNETIEFMSHFHPLSSTPSQSDKNNASMFYRNNEKYPHANPNAQLEIMYLGNDGELKATKY